MIYQMFSHLSYKESGRYFYFAIANANLKTWNSKDPTIHFTKSEEDGQTLQDFASIEWHKIRHDVKKPSKGH